MAKNHFGGETGRSKKDGNSRRETQKNIEKHRNALKNTTQKMHAGKLNLPLTIFLTGTMPLKRYIKLIRRPYQTCAEMLSLLRTLTKQLKWTSKRKKSMGKAVGKRMRGAPEPGAPAPATAHSPRILFLTVFTIDFSRFEVHFSYPVWVLRRDSISAHIWYGLRTILR